MSFILQEKYLLDLQSSLNNNDFISNYILDEYPLEKNRLNKINIFKNNAPELKFDKRTFIDKINVFGEKNQSEHDLNNAIILHKSLSINRYIASDPRLWTYLCHGPYFNYTKNRHLPNTRSNKILNLDRYHSLAKKEQDTIKNYIINTFFLFGKSLAAKRRNSISRLWWVAELTACPEIKYGIKTNPQYDEYHYTKIIVKNTDLWLGLLERSFGINPQLMFAICDVMYDLKVPTNKTKPFLRKINTYLAFRDLQNFDYNRIVDEFKTSVNLIL